MTVYSKKNIQQILYLVICLIAFSLLWLNYTTNIFQVVENEWFLSWQQDSEALIWERIAIIQNKGILYNAGLLGDYTSQIGLGGTLYGLLSLVISSKYLPTVLYSLNSFLLCVTLFVFLKWCLKEFGLISTITVYIFLFFNQWLLVSARNLYWMTFTFFLPFVCSIHFLSKDTNKSVHIKQWCLVAFSVIFFRAACGFEMISLVMINLEIPVFYYAVKQKWGKCKFLKIFFALVVSAILGFIICMLLHWIQLIFYCNGDIIEATSSILENIAYRTGIGTKKSVNYVSLINESLMAPKLDVIKMYFNEGKPIVFNWNMDLICYVGLLCMILSLIAPNVSTKIYEKQRQLVSLDISILISFLGPLSWFILASAHSYVHTHINYFLWSMPTTLLIAALCGEIIGMLILEFLQKYRWKFFLSIGLVSILGLFFYYDNTKEARTYMEELSVHKPLCYSSDASVYFFDNCLFVKIPSNSIAIPFFFHIYTDLQNFDNHDFRFKTYELELPFWFESKLARIDLTEFNIGIGKIEIGQFDGESRIWSESFCITEPHEINVMPLTDQNWTNGFSNDENYFLADKISVTNNLLIGKKVLLPDGTITTIDDVKIVGEYQWIHTKENIAKFNLSTIKIQGD